VIVGAGRIAVNENNVATVPLILTVDHQTPFELHLQKGVVVDVAGD
jgi:hypothetical protein